MDKQYQSTLKGATLIDARRCGNSIRIIDNAIQIIFSGKICVVRDHYKHGEDQRVNRQLFDQILRRMETEHSLTYLVELKHIRIDRSKFEIELL